MRSDTSTMYIVTVIVTERDTAHFVRSDTDFNSVYIVITMIIFFKLLTQKGFCVGALAPLI